MNCLESGEHLVLGSQPVTVSNKVNYKQRKFFLVTSYASQHTILYNSGKKPKFVGCKIGSMRSRMVLLIIRRNCSCTMTSRKTHLDFEQISGCRQRSLTRPKILPRCVLSNCFFHFLVVFKVFINVSIQTVLAMNLVEDRRIMCLAALFADSQIHMEEQRYRSFKSSFLEIVFSLYIQQ